MINHFRIWQQPKSADNLPEYVTAVYVTAVSFWYIGLRWTLWHRIWRGDNITVWKVKLGQIKCVYSNLTETETTNAPEPVRNFFQNLPAEFKEKVLVTPEALKLAQTYVEEEVVGETSMDDCIHIATATLKKVDMLVSWNFKHIVNV